MRTAKKSAKNGEIDILEIPRRNIGGDRLQNPLSRIWQARPYDQTGAGCIGGINFSTQQMFGAVPLVWICNPDPLSIRIFNPQKQ
jgi:hypothetical protein